LLSPSVRLLWGERKRTSKHNSVSLARESIIHILCSALENLTKGLTSYMSSLRDTGTSREVLVKQMLQNNSFVRDDSITKRSCRTELGLTTSRWSLTGSSGVSTSQFVKGIRWTFLRSGSIRLIRKRTVAARAVVIKPGPLI